MQNTFIVEVDALGLPGGCAKKGEEVTREQIGTENVERLLLQHAIAPSIFSNPEAPVDAPVNATVEPETLEARLAVGLPPVEGYVLSEEEAAWVEDVKAGVVPVPFDADKVSDLTAKVIIARIVALGGTVDPKGKKAEAVDALNDAVEAYFSGWETEAEDEDEAEAEKGKGKDKGK